MLSRFTGDCVSPDSSTTSRPRSFFLGLEWSRIVQLLIHLMSFLEVIVRTYFQHYWRVSSSVLLTYAQQKRGHLMPSLKHLDYLLLA